MYRRGRRPRVPPPRPQDRCAGLLHRSNGPSTWAYRCRRCRSCARAPARTTRRAPAPACSWPSQPAPPCVWAAHSWRARHRNRAITGRDAGRAWPCSMCNAAASSIRACAGKSPHHRSAPPRIRVGTFQLHLVEFDSSLPTRAAPTLRARHALRWCWVWSSCTAQRGVNRVGELPVIQHVTRLQGWIACASA